MTSSAQTGIKRERKINKLVKLQIALSAVERDLVVYFDIFGILKADIMASLRGKTILVTGAGQGK